jgi:hypothetical protein
MRVPHLCKVGMNLIVSRKTTWKILPNVKKENTAILTDLSLGLVKM